MSDTQNPEHLDRPPSHTAAIQNAIAQILMDLHICAVERGILEQAIALNFQDFEDAVQCACAMAHGVDAIVTRDASGFVSAGILVLSLGELENFPGE